MEDSRLIVGLECGGSDAMSGITANPVMGLVSDRIAAAGGTVILTEIDEMVGTEEVLRRQLVSEELGCQLTELIRDTYQRRSGFFHVYNGRGLSVGTLDGGVTTIQEQSLGCIKKGGSTPILQLLDYGQVPDEHGLVIMDGPGQDTDSMAGLVASGAQMILFSTGRGTPAGVPIASVVKIASNSRIYGAQRCDFDFNANGSEGDGSLGDPELLASRLHGLVLETACGRETAAERNLQNGFMTIWCKNFTV